MRIVFNSLPSEFKNYEKYVLKFNYLLYMVKMIARTEKIFLY